MIYILRHGKTDWNKRKKLQGRTDIPLCDEGRAMAREAAEMYADVHFDVCYSSPLSRARETETTLTTQGYKYLFVTDADPGTFNQPDKIVQIPGSRYAFLNGVFEGLVGCIMFDGIQKIRGNGYYCSDLIDGPFKFGNNFLRNSKIEEV